MLQWLKRLAERLASTKRGRDVYTSVDGYIWKNETTKKHESENKEVYTLFVEDSAFVTFTFKHDAEDEGAEVYGQIVDSDHDPCLLSSWECLFSITRLAFLVREDTSLSVRALKMIIDPLIIRVARGNSR